MFRGVGVFVIWLYSDLIGMLLLVVGLIGWERVVDWMLGEGPLHFIIDEEGRSIFWRVHHLAYFIYIQPNRYNIISNTAHPQLFISNQ